LPFKSSSDFRRWLEKNQAESEGILAMMDQGNLFSPKFPEKSFRAMSKCMRAIRHHFEGVEMLPARTKTQRQPIIMKYALLNYLPKEHYDRRSDSSPRQLQRFSEVAGSSQWIIQPQTLNAPFGLRFRLCAHLNAPICPPPGGDAIGLPANFPLPRAK
jgi:hypothetical protein